MVANKKILYTISVLSLLVLFSVRSGFLKAEAQNSGNPYAEIVRVKEGKSLPYLQNYYKRANSCILDAAVLSVAYFYDKRSPVDFVPSGEKDPVPAALFPMDPTCTTTLGLRERLLEIQYAICDSMSTLEGNSVSYCNELGTKKVASTGKFYGVLFDQDANKEREIIREKLKPADVNAPDTANEPKIPAQKNPLSILRTYLMSEKDQYISSLLSVKDILISAGPQDLVSFGSRVEDEVTEAKIIVANTLEWYQQYFFSYPQHRMYMQLSKQLRTSALEMSKIARVFRQFTFKLPNSSVDGDKNKGS